MNAVLRLEPDWCYVVYPSWADVSYKWEDLHRHLSDPINSPYVRDEPNNRRFYQQLYGDAPPPAEPFELVTGRGGGIIRRYREAGARSMSDAILGSEANVRLDGCMFALWDKTGFDAGVSYIEPWDPPGAEFGMGKRKKLYLAGASTEHADAAGGHVYWMVVFLKGKGDIKGLAEIPEWARSLGLAASRVAVIPGALAEETAPWFNNAKFDRTWYQVTGGGDGVGFHLAIVLYLALHLRKIAGRRLCGIHLVANIEGKPNALKLLWLPTAP